MASSKIDNTVTAVVEEFRVFVGNVVPRLREAAVDDQALAEKCLELERREKAVSLREQEVERRERELRKSIENPKLQEGSIEPGSPAQTRGHMQFHLSNAPTPTRSLAGQRGNDRFVKPEGCDAAPDPAAQNVAVPTSGSVATTATKFDRQPNGSSRFLPPTAPVVGSAPLGRASTGTTTIEKADNGATSPRLCMASSGSCSALKAMFEQKVAAAQQHNGRTNIPRQVTPLRQMRRTWTPSSTEPEEKHSVGNRATTGSDHPVGTVTARLQGYDATTQDRGAAPTAPRRTLAELLKQEEEEARRCH